MVRYHLLRNIKKERHVRTPKLTNLALSKTPDRKGTVQISESIQKQLSSVISLLYIQLSTLGEEPKLKKLGKAEVVARMEIDEVVQHQNGLRTQSVSISALIATSVANESDSVTIEIDPPYVSQLLV